MEAMASKAPHLLLLPYEQQGHINPMLSLASQVIALGCKVTFVRPEKQAAAEEEEEGAAPPAAALSVDGDGESDGLRFVGLGSSRRGLPVVDKLEDMKTALHGLEARQARIAELVEESKTSAHPISCIISDFFMWRWVAQVAGKLGLQAALLWTSCGLSFYELFLEHKRKGAEMDEALVSLPRKEHKAARYGLLDRFERDRVLGFLDSLFEGFQETSLPVLVNSSKQLEATIVQAMDPLLELLVGGSRLDLRFVGPCFPAWDYGHGKVDSRMARRAGGVMAQRTEDEICLPWLDQQADKSVLFVSIIGSESGIDLPEGLVEEIAMGIEQSGCRCLWVARPDALPSCRPSVAFQQRMAGEGRAMFVGWAPQKRVLQHAAVGGFLTHSGWNSTVESLSCGVPMLCLPLMGDQPLNAFLVYCVWQAGLTLIPPHENNNSAGPLISRDQVQNSVQALLDGRFSARLAQLRQTVVSDQQNTLASFVRGVTKSITTYA